MKAMRVKWSNLARSEPLGSVLVYCSMAVATLAIAIVLLFVRSITPTERAVVIVTGLVAWVLLIALGWERGSLPLRPLLVAIALTLVCAVSTPSNQSTDVFSYAMYGRILTEHHKNPYNSYPMQFEGDPMRRNVGQFWQRTPDIYGPAFTVVMGALAPAIGQSTFLARFLYQLIALAAVGALLWILWRRTRNPTVLAFLGLHPLLAISVVNGGHPDALIALGFVLAAFWALEGRVVWCALALAFGVAINFSVIVGAGALVVWAWWRWPRRDVVKLAAVTVGVGALPYPFLSGWLQNAHAHQQLISRQSIWNPISTVLAMPIADLKTIMPNGSTLAAGVLLLVVFARFTRRATPDLAMAAAIAVFLVTSPWVMPWYAFAAFPFLAMMRPTLLAWAVAIYSALILVGDQFPSLSSKAIGSVSHLALELAAPTAACVACVYAIVFLSRERAREVDELVAVAA